MSSISPEEMRKVYITGLGFISSIGNDKSAVETSLRELRHGFELYPPFQQPRVPVKVMGTIKEFDVSSLEFEDWTYPARYSIRRELLRSMAPHGLYAHCAMLQAIDDARLAEADLQSDATGLYCASAGSPMLLAHYLRRINELGVNRVPPVSVVSAIAGTLNFNLVAAFKIHGHSCGFTSACASTGHALGFAYDDVATGRQDRMIVVGAEDGNSDAILPFATMRALSTATDPALASRPFDAERDGFVGTAVRRSSSSKARRRWPAAGRRHTPSSQVGAKPPTDTTSRSRTPRDSVSPTPCARGCARPAWRLPRSTTSTPTPLPRPSATPPR
jgi:3-oxoacyl-[acyl-carrier-protein] synthase-1